MMTKVRKDTVPSKIASRLNHCFRRSSTIRLTFLEHLFTIVGQRIVVEDILAFIEVIVAFGKARNIREESMLAIAPELVEVVETHHRSSALWWGKCWKVSADRCRTTSTVFCDLSFESFQRATKAAFSPDSANPHGQSNPHATYCTSKEGEPNESVDPRLIFENSAAARNHDGREADGRPLAISARPNDDDGTQNASKPQEKELHHVT